MQQKDILTLKSLVCTPVVYLNLLLIVHKRKPASLTNQTLQFIFGIQLRPTLTVL